MIIRDAKVGDKVLVHLRKDGYLTFSAKDNETSLIPTTILSHHPPYATKLGWKTGEVIPKIITKIPHPKDEYIVTHEYNSEIECILINDYTCYKDCCKLELK